VTQNPPENLPDKTKSNEVYLSMLNEVVELMETSRRQASRSINSIMTATYWEIGRRIVEFEQLGESRAEYGKQLISRLAHDLSTRFGRGFSKRNLEQMRRFYLLWSITQTPSAQSQVPDFKQKFPLPCTSTKNIGFQRSVEVRRSKAKKCAQNHIWQYFGKIHNPRLGAT